MSRWPVKKSVEEIIRELEERWPYIYEREIEKEDLVSEDFERGYQEAIKELYKIDQGIKYE